MRERGLEDQVGITSAVKPVEEGLHRGVEPSGDGRFIMDALTAIGTGDDLHRPRHARLATLRTKNWSLSAG
jgi:hypothetical protein